MLMVLIVLVPSILLFLLMDKPIKRDFRIMTKDYEKINGRQIEMINSILTIKTSSVEQPVFDKWTEEYNVYYKSNRGYQINLNVFMVTSSALITLSPIVILVFAILYAQTGFMTIGVAMAFYTMTTMLFSSINTILYNVRDFQDNLITFERIDDIMQHDEEFLHTAAEVSLDGDIEIDNISFKYAKEGNYVLQNISCVIAQNSKVAIIGDSGSGKSTFLKVLSGLYEIDSGAILFNSNLMSNVRASIKNQIGYVAQNVWPMNQSIKEYILLGMTSVKMEDVERACKIVNIHDEIISMPMKYNTIISENGKNISGGQSQRIMLARMILLDPKILLLDEATSALDTANENKILDYFYSKNCTVIMITHKLEYIKKCNNILMLKNGTLFGQGKYNELEKNMATILFQ